jgi:hypothetical protein
MFRFIDRLLTIAVLGIARVLLSVLRGSRFAGKRDRLAALWLDMSGVSIPAGAATDTSFGEVRLFYDFVELALDATNLVTTNSDTGGTAFAINEQHGGAIRGSVDTTDNDITNVFTPPIWEIDEGGYLIWEARATLITSIADGENYLGLTDDDGTDENPITLSAADVATTNATDAVGFAYTGAGTADWKAVSVANAVDGTVTRCNNFGATTPVAATWQTFKVVLNSDGDADFYINGVWHYREDAAVTTSVQLGFGAAVQSGGTARSMDIDYLYMASGRSAT